MAKKTAGVLGLDLLLDPKSLRNLIIGEASKPSMVVLVGDDHRISALALRLNVEQHQFRAGRSNQVSTFKLPLIRQLCLVLGFHFKNRGASKFYRQILQRLHDLRCGKSRFHLVDNTPKLGSPFVTGFFVYHLPLIVVAITRHSI